MASSSPTFEIENGEEGIINTPGQCGQSQKRKKRIKGTKKLTKNRNNKIKNQTQTINNIEYIRSSSPNYIQSTYINNNNNNNEEKEPGAQHQNINNNNNDRLLHTQFSYSTNRDNSPSINFISHSRHSSNRSNASTVSQMSQMSHLSMRSINDSYQSSNMSASASALSVSIPQSHFYPTPQSSFDSLSSPTELTKLQNWLTSFGLQCIYQKLIKAGYDSMLSIKTIPFFLVF